MAVKTEQGCYTEHLERVLKFDHKQAHQGGVADHGHYHAGAGDHRPDKAGASHHGNGEAHNDYKPEQGGYLHYHTHPHEDEGDPLAALDVGATEIAVAENVSSDSYSEDLFSNLGSGGDSSLEMGGFLDALVS